MILLLTKIGYLSIVAGGASAATLGTLLAKKFKRPQKSWINRTMNKVNEYMPKFK